MSCPQIWYIEQEKDKEKEKVGGRPAKLDEKKRRQGSRATDKKKTTTTTITTNKKQRNSGGEKMRNAICHQCKVKMGGIKKK